jgi:hypothetical protein
LEKPEKTGFFSVGFLEKFGLRLGCGFKIFGGFQVHTLIYYLGKIVEKLEL